MTLGPAWAMTVPVSKDQWVTVLSNMPMDPENFDTLAEYLAMQREISCDPAQGGVTRMGGDGEAGSEPKA
jgi:hypothetical protein